MILKAAPFDETINRIDSSLYPLLFQSGGDNLSRYFFSDENLLVQAAETIIKFSSLVIQIYWLKITSEHGHKDKISPELDRILKQIWAGHLKHSTGHASSILHYASISDKNTHIGKLVENPTILIKWNEIISVKDGFYKKYEELLLANDIYELYVDLIQALPVLNRVTYKNDKFILRDFNNIKIDSFPFLHYFKSYYDNPLMLFGITQKENSAVLIFEEPHHSEKFEFEISATLNSSSYEKYNWIKTIMGFDSVKNVSEGLAYLFDGGYKHIHNIAKAIVIKTGDKKEVNDYIAATKKKYGDTSPEHPEDVVTLIIADIGPAIVLRDLLCKNQSFLNAYLEYFESIGLKSKSYWENRREQYVREKILNIQDIVGLEGTMKKRIENKIKDESYIWCMLNAAGSNQESKEPFVDSINRRRRSILNYKNTWNDLSDDEILGCIKDYPGWTNDIFERTFKFLIIFYSSISKIYALGDFNETNKQPFDIDAAIPEIEDFIQIEYRKIYNKTVGQLMRIFQTDIIGGNMPLISESLRYFLGRDMDYFMRQNAIKESFKKVCEKVNFNWSKHDFVRPNPKQIGLECLEASVKLFNFFQFGNFDTHLFQRFTLTPIYPMVISFREAHRNREGMNIYYYEIYSFDEDESESTYNIKILTEQKYYQNEEYYCIPNVKRSSKDWWIDPLLIQCSKFDNIFMKLREKHGS